MAPAGQNSEQARQAQDVDAIPTLAWAARPDGSAEFLNRRWLDYTGLSAEEARASITTACAQAVSILQDGLSHDWTRSQYLAAINGKPNSGPFLSIRRTLEGPTDWDKNAGPLKLAMQDLLRFFTKNLSQLRPPNASQQVTTSP